MSMPPLTPEQRRREFVAAKRWHGRMGAAREARGDRDAMRCHEQAMRHLYLALGYVPREPGPGKLL